MEALGGWERAELALGSMAPCTLCGWSQTVSWVLGLAEGWMLDAGVEHSVGDSIAWLLEQGCATRDPFLTPTWLPGTSRLSPPGCEVLQTCL